MKRIPLYPDEATIAELVLGPGRVVEWNALAVVLERDGFPKADMLFGGRFWPACERYFLNRYGLNTIAPGPVMAPDGGETNFGPRPKRRDPSPAPVGTVTPLRRE